MLQQTQSEISVRSYELTFDWNADLERLSREVEAAEATGVSDDLSVAEMECTIDLIDAELLALRSNIGATEAARRQIDQLLELRGKLLKMIGRMQAVAGGGRRR